eukprot:CAMPEP_0202890232 /NCGR_PEP_ID=MMETSP1392-20130828/721_1 /ASSEMBLY_ACC=CAM_ASM_000868 /TAXON_ID=225041 /ORGANISM="Chlamydomonas chlamydogama, Strain SAG 11-48b" /LENGTH=479 /DNA_ID=CAMNT_0049573769 /DNA_START=242 /DNA_END=1678 /DNA_ORIENTATION=-
MCDCDYDTRTGKPKRGALARTVEQREVRRRAQDAARGEIERYYNEQRAYDVQAGNPMKDDIKRREREAKERAQEAQMLDSLYQAEKTRELALIRAEEEEKLTNALSRRQQEKDRKDKEIQRLREQSSELRDLAEKIRIARMNKERSLQLQEKAQIKQQQMEYDHAFNTYVEQSEAAAAAREAEAQARRREQNVKARMVLEEQMLEKQDALRLAEEEHLRERMMVDEVVRRIMEEDQAESALRRQKQDETKAFIAQFLEEQDVARRAKAAAEREEERKIQDYWSMVREREAAEAQKAALRKEVADRMYEKVKREMEEEARKKDEEEMLINMLRQEELEEKRRQEEEERRRRAEQLRAEIQRSNEIQMRLKAEREAAMKAEEEEFRRRMMAKFAEDDRIEQLNAQKRRMKLVEHQRAVAAMIEDKRRMYEEQKARDEAELAAQRLDDERKLALLEEERKRLLREAAELRDFLPRGVIRDQA